MKYVLSTRLVFYYLCIHVASEYLLFPNYSYRVRTLIYMVKTELKSLQTLNDQFPRKIQTYTYLSVLYNLWAEVVIEILQNHKTNYYLVFFFISFYIFYWTNVENLPFELSRTKTYSWYIFNQSLCIYFFLDYHYYLFFFFWNSTWRFEAYRTNSWFFIHYLGCLNFII